MAVYDKRLISKLERKANLIRQHVVRMVHLAGSGHPGGSLSAVEVIVALYFHVMNIDPKRPDWPDRDRFILSKGHGCPAWYATLAEKGYLPVKELDSLRKLGSRLQGHPDMKVCPGVEASTGSEGQGLSMGVGMALAARLDRKLYHVYVMIGDGELDCGQTWEAAMAASHFHVDNLTAIVDRNMLQLDGPTAQIMSVEPLADKWKAFGWHVTEIDGHNFKEILRALEKSKDVKGRPNLIIAHTTKGKGVSYMEGAVSFHGKAPTREEYELAMEELGGKP
jgi:transketolase